MHLFQSHSRNEIYKELWSLLLSRIQFESSSQLIPDESLETPTVLEDSLFVRHQDKMVKVPISDIHYIEAERNYCRIYSANKEYLLVLSLREMEEKLPE